MSTVVCLKACFRWPWVAYHINLMYSRCCNVKIQLPCHQSTNLHGVRLFQFFTYGVLRPYSLHYDITLFKVLNHKSVSVVVKLLRIIVFEHGILCISKYSCRHAAQARI